MPSKDSQFAVRLAASERDLWAAQRLRYQVFIKELGGTGVMVDHDQGLERDEFDAFSEHLLLIDRRLEAEGGDYVVGVYRMMMRENAERAGRFYCASEYDLGPLLASGRSLLELGRSCVHKDYRGGTSMYLLWNALAKYVLSHGVEVMFGVASFHGNDPQAIAAPLAYLHWHHLAPPEMRVRALPPNAQRMDLLPEDQVDRVEAMKEIPALIKAYLRLGGFVGEGAYIDHEFNTIDVCLMMDTANMNARSREAYVRKAGR